MVSKKNKAEARAERAAQLREEQRKAERSRQLKVVLGVVVMVLVLIGAGFAISKFVGDKNDSPDEITDAQTIDSGDTGGDSSIKGGATEFGMLLGPEDADTSVVIYEDFLCPFCGALENEISEDLQKAAEAGDVRVEYRPINLLSGVGDYSMRSASAFKVVLDTVGVEAARDFHNALFANQPAESGPFPDNDQLVQLAVQSGANAADVTKGIQDTQQKAWVDKATDNALEDVGVEGTPTVYLNGKIVEGTSLDDMVEQIRDAL